MIPNTANPATVKSTMTGERIEMKMDPDAAIHLQEVLTHIASDPEEYVLREYSVNALDSHIEAGQTLPVEISLPSEHALVLRIKDKGVGLNAQDIRTVYSLYGASTKRETNEQTGSLGLGCKSALAYGTQFSVIGVKDGIRTMIRVAKDEDGAGVMKIVEEVETDEPNGVEVIVPVRQYNKFKEKAAHFFRFWPEGSVLINGEPPAPLGGLSLTDTIKLAPKEHHSQPSYIVMGNVPYKIPQEANPFNGADKYALVAYVGMGDVNFTPSREDLRMSKRTKTCLEEIGKQIQGALAIAVQKDVEAATTFAEAATKVNRWRDALGKQMPSNALHFKGIEVPYRLTLPEIEGKPTRRICVVEFKSRKIGAHSMQAAIEVGTLSRSIVIPDFTPSKFTPAHKRKLVAYCERQGIETDHFVLLKDELDLRWVEPERIIPYEEIKAVKVESETYISRGWKVSGSYEAWTIIDGETRHHKSMLAEDIDTQHPIYYFDRTTFATFAGFSSWDSRGADDDVCLLLKDFRPNCTILKLGLNRVEKFKRDFPSATPVKEMIESFYRDQIARLPSDVLKAWKLREEYEDHRAILARLDPKKLDDPSLQSAIGLATLKTNAYLDRIERISECGLRHWLDLDAVDFNTIDLFDLAEEYPLLVNEGLCPHDHNYIYANHIYAITQESE